MISPGLTCDIFCRVVDNFGDIGVCWRLARQLKAEQGVAVRLIVDDLASFSRIAPDVDIADVQAVNGISIVVWREPFVAALLPANLVIEAFGCELPPSYVAVMASHKPGSVWINLEYLSAESWVGGHHLLPSPHAIYPLTKYFFFPGFRADTGGLIREKEVAPNFTAVLAEERSAECRVFIFAYAHAPAIALLDAMTQMESPVHCRIPVSAISDKLQHWRASQGKNGLEGAPVLEFVDFAPQVQFDAALAECDVLFVRGEDSFVRAIWSGRPFVWQIYPQSAGAHLEKLSAFLDLYCEGLSMDAHHALRELWRAWNEADEAAIGGAWQAFYRALPELKVHAAQWAARQSEMPDLVSNLLSFYQKTAKI